MKKILFVLAVELLIANVANAATDEYEGCLEYNKPVTLTGTVLLRKINYGKNDDVPPEGSVLFPLLVLDQPICLRPSNDEDIAEGMEWTLQISYCLRRWPKSSRVRVTGTLFHLFNWHHHSKVLILAKQIERLDGRLSPCQKEPESEEAGTRPLLPAKFVGEWCRIEGKDILGVYRRGRCPGKNGLRIRSDSYDFYTKARCQLTEATNEGSTTRAVFMCSLGRNDRDREMAAFSMKLNNKQQLVIANIAGD